MKIGIYCRVSTEDQAREGLSLAGQEDRIRAYCHARGWDIYEPPFIDDGVSGKSLVRPALQRMLLAIQAGEIDGVVVYKLDRLSRRQRDILELLEDKFATHSIQFASVTENIDTSTPAGRAMIGVLGVFAQLERELIIERVTAGKEDAAKKGKWKGGPVPYGYDYDEEKKILVINELKADIVRKIYSLYLEENMGYQQIADTLNEKGIPGPAVESWNKVTIARILKSPWYTGQIHFRDDILKGNQEPIIDKDLWLQALAQHESKSIRSIAKYEGLLKGRIFCGECGHRMRTKASSGTYYYVCYAQSQGAKARKKGLVKTSTCCDCGYKRIDTIDNYVIERLKALSLSKRAAKKAVDEMINNIYNPSIKEIARKKKQIELTQNGLNRWYEAFEKGSLDADELNGRVQELRNRLKNLNEDLLELESKKLEYEEKISNAEDLLMVLSQFSTLWTLATEEERRILVQNLIKKVIVYKNDKAPDIEFWM